MQGTHTFTLGTVDALGRVHLSPAGHDLLKACLMRGMNRAKRGLAAARQTEALGGGDLVGGSITYYKHAMAFMAHLITSDNGGKIDLREELQELRGMAEGEEYPTAWQPFLVLAKQIETPDVPPHPAPSRNRANSRRKRGSNPAEGDGGR